MNTCSFCGPTESPLTEEHIWPEWMSRILREPGYPVDHFRHLESQGDNTTKNWKGRYLDITTETLCGRCNNEWLSVFEKDHVRRLMGPMLVGEPSLSLLPSGQAILAAWAYKMALLLDVRLPDHDGGEFYTPAERRQFRQTTCSNPLVRVYLAKYAYGHRPAHAKTPRHGLTERHGQQRAFSLKISTITAGNVALQVTAFRPVEGGDLVPASDFEFKFVGKAVGAISRIWPPADRLVSWPPTKGLTHEDIEEWTDAWVKTHE